MLASSSSSPALATSPQATRREVSVPVYEGSSLTTEFPQLVHLNVGGRKLMTTLATLQMDSDSMLGLMFSGKLPVLRDADGCFFIDRDGRQFHHILNYLRDGTLPIGLSRVDRLELLREADFYGLKALYSFIGGPTVQAAMMTGGGTGLWLRGLCHDLAKAEAADFSVNSRSHRVYARLRYGQEYSGDWIVSSPRNLPHVQYELYDACLARDPITALNKMGAAGFRPCVEPPTVPASTSCQNDDWEIMLYKDVWQ
ncbi:kctd6 [Symbiodinium sp. CCMP2592]|nr:kctd6 [Symbiodinium microadriaticum]CAE7670198.1 kctd6 [Symbiodinium sp. CCMP2592]